MAWFPCNLNSNLGGKLLWTNPSPTASFSAQTISLDLSKYEGVIVEFSNDNSAISDIVSKVYWKRGDGTLGAGKGPVTVQGRSRSFNCNDTGVTFYNAYNGSTMINHEIVPQHIYGVNLSI